MPSDVIREAKAAAARRGVPLSAVIAEAVSRSLVASDRTPVTEDCEDALARDMEWFAAQRVRLAKQYRGEYIAIVDQQVVDHAPEFEELAQRVFASHGNRAVYIPRATPEPPIARVRSPRRVAE
jgi:hypothetical protein